MLRKAKSSKLVEGKMKLQRPPGKGGKIGSLLGGAWEPGAGKWGGVPVMKMETGWPTLSK